MGKPVAIKINGREIQADSDQYVLNVAMEHGIFVPHYCWHPGLSPEGNCRMCLVKVSTSRKLEVACMTRCADKLEVETENPEVQKARRDVLEFLLINHPLDCPICDKSGECMLQDYTYTWRGGLSRFLGLEAKNLRPTKDLGPNIRFWGNRCVVCTRCVRFLQEVSGSGQLAVVERGDHNTIDTAPGVPLDDPLSLNVVDLCPVGALIDKEFLFQARVWYTKRTPSLCASCSTGCNTTITSLDNEIKRIQPRLNKEVNGHWMCDEGRRHHRYLRSNRRLARRIGTPDEAARALRAAVERHGPGAVAALCSSFNTCEELTLFKEIFDRLGVTQIGFLTAFEGEDRVFQGGFTIHADKTPNFAYLKKLYGEERLLEGPNRVISLLADDRIKMLFVMNGIPDRPYPRALCDLLGRVEELILVDILRSPLSERANVVLPGAGWAEKSGTFVNYQGREQTFKPALQPPGDAAPEAEILTEISLALESKPAPAAAKS
jgi:NADH-quinone oxidoreductase subunit G